MLGELPSPACAFVELLCEGSAPHQRFLISQHGFEVRGSDSFGKLPNACGGMESSTIPFTGCPKCDEQNWPKIEIKGAPRARARELPSSPRNWNPQIRLDWLACVTSGSDTRPAVRLHTENAALLPVEEKRIVFQSLFLSRIGVDLFENSRRL